MSTVGVIVLVFVLAGLSACVVVLVRTLRRQVCLRRADCCGKGCGCLFPARRD